MRTKRLLFALCSRARLCYPRLAGSGAAPRGDPPPGHLVPSPGARWLPGRALPIATRRDRTWPGLGCGGVELGGQGCAKSQLPIPGGTAGAFPRPLRWVRAKDFAWFWVSFWFKKKKKRWMRCWGADHSPGSMVGRAGFGDPCRSLPYGTIL